MNKFFRKYHKWISIVFTLFILLFAVSGIILNHRRLLSGVDVSRSVLPSSYAYRHWNNAAVRSTLRLSADSILIYGNIGIWLTDSVQSGYTDFNTGISSGIDNRKTDKLFRTGDGTLLAGTLFGLYRRSVADTAWSKVPMPDHNLRVVDIAADHDTLLILTRSYLWKTTDLIHFERITLPPPVGYDHKVGLFRTLWVIHSGEIYGEAGRLIVDLMGIIIGFLTVSGLIIFVNRLRAKKKTNPADRHSGLTEDSGQKNIPKDRRSGLTEIKRQKTNPADRRIGRLKVNKRLLNWHNKAGWMPIIFLLITSATGIFLRPPFLIPIANATVDKIPYSLLDTDNAWFDQLRRVLYDEEKDRFLIATADRLYYSDDHFRSELRPFVSQPPMSVMGVNVFRKVASATYMIGSFEGLFLWHAPTGMTMDYIKKIPYRPPAQKSRPLGEFMVTGYSADFTGREVYFDYNHGARELNNLTFGEMPAGIARQPISLWNTALEFHTGRIFQGLLGDFYILIVPLTGLALLFILVSGFVLWYRLYRRTNGSRRVEGSKGRRDEGPKSRRVEGQKSRRAEGPKSRRAEEPKGRGHK